MSTARPRALVRLASVPSSRDRLVGDNSPNPDNSPTYERGTEYPPGIVAFLQSDGVLCRVRRADERLAAKSRPRQGGSGRPPIVARWHGDIAWGNGEQLLIAAKCRQARRRTRPGRRESTKRPVRPYREASSSPARHPRRLVCAPGRCLFIVTQTDSGSHSLVLSSPGHGLGGGERQPGGSP
jgi:hypothetical protein